MIEQESGIGVAESPPGDREPGPRGRILVVDDDEAIRAMLTELLAAAGHEVVILDIVTRSFERLPSTFRGTALRGDGTDEDVLRRAGAEGADLFLAMTEGDNRNVMAAQVAGQHYQPAWGRNKKEAEQRAACNALSELKGEAAPFPSD